MPRSELVDKELGRRADSNNLRQGQPMPRMRNTPSSANIRSVRLGNRERGHYGRYSDCRKPIEGMPAGVTAALSRDGACTYRVISGKDRRGMAWMAWPSACFFGSSRAPFFAVTSRFWGLDDLPIVIPSAASNVLSRKAKAKAHSSHEHRSGNETFRRSSAGEILGYFPFSSR